MFPPVPESMYTLFRTCRTSSLTLSKFCGCACPYSARSASRPRVLYIGILVQIAAPPILPTGAIAQALGRHFVGLRHLRFVFGIDGLGSAPRGFIRHAVPV